MIEDRLLCESLERWAATRPDTDAHSFLEFDRRAARRDVVSYLELDVWSRAIAAHLGDYGRRGDRAAILAPPGLSYIAAFLGVLRSPLVGVPLFAPGLPGHVDRLEQSIADCQPSVLLTVADERLAVGELVRALDGVAEAPIVAVDQLRGASGSADAARYVRPTLCPSDLAYLQYTSGSTRAPAGVMLTHENVMSNTRQLVAAFGPHVGPTDAQAGVSWLPMFHDMGLILGLAMPLVTGCTGVTFDPIAFIQRPRRWLEALSGWDRAYSAAPNFAFGLVAKRVRDEDLESVNLRGVEAILNGAEPVTLPAMSAFAERLAPCGLRATALRPAYGLAEATVFVATTEPGTPPRGLRVDAMALQGNRLEPASDGAPAIEIVAHGGPWGQEIIIVDPETHQMLDTGEIGEIWVRGSNVGVGYWANPETTTATFDAEPADARPPLEGSWLRTGDLGAQLDGQLYITGRRKDLIVLDGRNIYPHDVEHTVEESHPAIAAHRSAAFGVADPAGAEAMVVVAERHREAATDEAALDEARTAAVGAIVKNHAVSVHEVLIVEPHSIPRTSSGKVARGAARQAYIDGTFHAALTT